MPVWTPRSMSRGESSLSVERRAHRPSDAPLRAVAEAGGERQCLPRPIRRRRRAWREITNELNVRDIELIPDESEMVERTSIRLPVIGPRHGPAVGQVMAARGPVTGGSPTTARWRSAA